MTESTNYPLPESIVTRAVVVDDDHFIRRAISRCLRQLGCDVVEAADGSEGIAAVLDTNPHVLVTDVGMPVIDGIDVVRRIKGDGNIDTFAIVMSGMLDTETRLRAFDAGADDFLCKPIHLPELSRRIIALRRRQQEKQALREAARRIEQLRLYTAEAIALLAHDLNNGLCSAISNIDYLLSVANLEGDQHDAMQSAGKAMQRMAGLVRNFVDLARSDGAALVPEHAEVDVFALIDGVVELHRHEADVRGAAFVVEDRSHTLATIDPTLLERMLHNLVGNAIRYVNHGGTIAVGAGYRANADGGTELAIWVGNSGAGISDGVRDRLFSKYGCGPDDASQCGMGLYFCRLASEAHGGSIGLEASDAYPATFVIRIPAHAVCHDASVVTRSSHVAG